MRDPDRVIDQQRAGRIRGDDVVLQVKRALRSVGQDRAHQNSLLPVGQQAKAGQAGCRPELRRKALRQFGLLRLIDGAKACSGHLAANRGTACPSGSARSESSCRLHDAYSSSARSFVGPSSVHPVVWTVGAHCRAACQRLWSQAYTDIVSGRYRGCCRRTYTPMSSMDSFAPVRQSVAVRVTVSVLAIFVVSLWSLSYYANSVLRSDMVRLLGQQQFSDVSIIAAQIDQELTHRLKALETVAGLSGPAMQEGPAAVQALLLQLPILQTLFNGGLVGVKPDGTAIAEVAQSVGRIGVNYADIDIVAAALKQDKSSIGQPVVGKKLMEPVFGMAVPIHGD